MRFNAIADRTEYLLRKLSKRAKSWLVVTVVAVAALMLIFGTLWIYNHIKYKRERAEYERKLQTSQQNYTCKPYKTPTSKKGFKT